METERDLTHVKQGVIEDVFDMIAGAGPFESPSRAQALVEMCTAVHNRAIEDAAALAATLMVRRTTVLPNGEIVAHQRAATGPEIADQIRAKLLRTP